MQEAQAWSLGWEDPPEKEMAMHFNIPTWKILAGYDQWGHKRVRYDLVTKQQQQNSY